MEERPSYRQMELRGGGGGASHQQQQQSPDSTQDSTEVSMEQQQQQQQQHIPTIQVHHHHHHQSHMASMMALMEDSANAHRHQHLPQHLGLSQDQNPYAAAAAAASSQQGSFFQQQGGNDMIVQAAVKEEPHSQQLAVPVFAMDQLYWAPSHDQAELMEPMSPESADLCRNLTSQLEHFRKELGTYYAESSTNNHHMLEQQQQQPQAAAAAEKTSIIPSPAGPAASASDLMPHSENEMLKAAIVSHPHYPELVAAHMNCHKVGAPPEVVSQIDEIIQNFKEFQPAVTTSIGVNPELDQFMVSYYTMLLKYEKEIKKTFKEAVAFCKKLEQQLQVVTNGSVSSVTSVESDERNDGYDTSEEEDSGAEVEIELDPMAKDKELKEQLMRKYSGYISSLKHEFLKKKKKGKLPKDSRQQLLNWWSLHYKWPYPSESEKASLAESTGLDQKQINNWFINQRKRHWKPSDELTVLGGQPSQNNVPEANSGT